MDISIKSIVMLGAVTFSGLSAGFFFAWSVSVIPGTLKVGDTTYLETMQSINRAILNPAFFAVFFGSLLLLAAASFYEIQGNKLVFWLMLSSTIVYLVGTIGVTGMGNVPLNNELDVLKLSEQTPSKLAEFRKYYESNWNRLHQIRTLCALAAFLLAALALMVNSNQ